LYIHHYSSYVRPFVVYTGPESVISRVVLECLGKNIEKDFWIVSFMDMDKLNVNGNLICVSRPGVNFVVVLTTIYTGKPVNLK